MFNNQKQKRHLPVRTTSRYWLISTLVREVLYSHLQMRELRFQGNRSPIPGLLGVKDDVNRGPNCLLHAESAGENGRYRYGS